MMGDILFLLKVAVAFLPFALFAFLNAKANMKKKIRYKQYFMVPLSIVYCAALYALMEKLSELISKLVMLVSNLFLKINWTSAATFVRNTYNNYSAIVLTVLFNTLAMLLYIIVKRMLTLIFKKRSIEPDSLKGKLIGVFYHYDEEDAEWYIRPNFGQARTFLKAVYYGGMAAVGIVMLISVALFSKGSIAAPFYPVFAVIIIGELAFFTDGLRRDERESEFVFAADRSTRIAFYPLIRKALKALFGDKMSSEGTTVNSAFAAGGSVEEVLRDMEEKGGHIGKNYSRFIRAKMLGGLKPNVDYMRSGYELSVGKSLLFNTPFYYKLVPYVFYAMSRALLEGGKVLIVLGRHGTTDDLKKWCEAGMLEVSNTPDLWTVEELTGKENEQVDIGIITRSGVHDLDVHKANLEFLKRTSFVVIVEPSRLVTTAQIGLNLLIKNCGKDRRIIYCSVDRNCDGLVDSLSHILMTNITEVSATEYPHGVSTYMCWTADNDRLQHRMVPGISRYLGMGTEFSFVALKNQVRNTVWYGGEAFPVLDAHWIAKQYYYDLLKYAGLPATQETFDKYFGAHFNMCDEKMSDYTYITVEDERNNVFETKRNFATIAEEQGFINVISSEYMLREYMTENTDLFNADPKAIPYITADYARTNRNDMLTLCLKLCVEGVADAEVRREMVLMGFESGDIRNELLEEKLWKEICRLFGDAEKGVIYLLDEKGRSVRDADGNERFFDKNTLRHERKYSGVSGEFEDIYSIEDKDFIAYIINDMRNAGYVAEREGKDFFIGSELKGHIYQKYLPGQLITLNGKYYEMLSVTVDNRILLRRASEHITGRVSYRQVRDYTIDCVRNSETIGEVKTVNGIGISRQFADFRVNTPAYWKLGAYNDFNHGELVEIKGNGVPERRYYNKQVLKLDFSKFGDSFTDSVRRTLTNMLNEVFVTLFADNSPFISAVTYGEPDKPLTYGLAFGEKVDPDDKSIYIIEDSQLDIGLLVAVERNLGRIFRIIFDYLSWDKDMTEKSKRKPAAACADEGDEMTLDEAEAALKPKKKKCFLMKFFGWIKSKFKRKNKKDKKGKDKDKDKEEKKKAKKERKEQKKREREERKARKKNGAAGQEPIVTEEQSADGDRLVEAPADEEAETPEGADGAPQSETEAEAEAAEDDAEFPEEDDAAVEDEGEFPEEDDESAEDERELTEGLELPAEESAYTEDVTEPVDAEAPSDEDGVTEETEPADAGQDSPEAADDGITEERKEDDYE